jgi:hypothetical protein
MPTDLTQNQFGVGDIVNLPCVVVSIGGTTAEPTVTLETQYPAFDGDTDSAGTVDAIQVILSR